MKLLLLFILCASSLFAKIHYAKIEPYSVETIAAKGSGEIVMVKEEWLGKRLSQEPFIMIDTVLDRIDLQAVRTKIRSVKKMIEADMRIVSNLEESVSRKTDNYNRIKNLSVKSKTQKDALFFDLVATKNQLLSTRKELENFRLQLADLESRSKHLEKTIKDKTVRAPGKVLYELTAKAGAVVAPGTPLAKVADTSKGLLTIYVDRDELEGIRNKKVFLNGKATAYRVSRVVRIADSVNISKYKAQIVIKAPKIYSQLIKVELR